MPTAAHALSLESWVLEREKLRNALAVTRAALEFARDECALPVVVGVCRDALADTDEIAGC